MKIFKFFLLMGVGCFALGAWARSPADAESATAQRLSEQRRAELRAALKASQGPALVDPVARQEVLDPGRTLPEGERAQRRQQLRQQLREIRYELP
jgi:hypothetical protein